MPTARQLCIWVVAADVILFLVASAFNDHSNTSVDGFVWWAALALFAALIAIAVLSWATSYGCACRRAGETRTASAGAPVSPDKRGSGRLGRPHSTAGQRVTNLR